jgi:hypothetical protein
MHHPDCLGHKPFRPSALKDNISNLAIVLAVRVDVGWLTQSWEVMPI